MIKSDCFFVFVVWILATLLLGGCATVEQSPRVFHYVPSQVLRGHTSLVKSVAWSPDGKRLVSAGLALSGSDTVRMWNAVTGKQEWGLQAHVTEKFEGKSLPLVSSVVWSPDGKHLATSGAETIRLWDTTTGREERILRGDAREPFAATAVAWSPHGKHLASGGTDGIVRVWNAINGEQERILQGHTAEVNLVAWSPDGSKLASCGSDKTVRLWNAVTGEEERVLSGHTSFVQSVAWSPDGKRVASGGNDDTVRLWNTVTGEEERPLQANVAPGGPGSSFSGIVFSVAWSSDGKVLAFGGADGTVRLLNVLTGRVEQVLHGHYGEVLSVAWSPEGTRLASSDFNGTIMLWEIDLSVEGLEKKETADKPEKKKVDKSKENQRSLDEETALKEAETAFDSNDYTKALALLKPLAERGNPRAQNGLGLIYGRGLGIPKDFNEAFIWHQKAAEQGYGLAQYYLGLMYADGQGVPRDAAEGAKWLRKSADQGYPPSQTILGTLYGTGDGVPLDHSEAMQWYRKATDQGYPDAQWRVGAMYAEGQGVPKDYVEAEKWFRKAVAQGHPHGQLWLGRLYLEGWGLSQNIAEAAKWYKLAVDQLHMAGVLVERSENAQGTSASALLLKALIYPPETGALSYLSVSHDLKFAEIARDSETFHFFWNAHIDGRPKIIDVDKSNAEPLVAVLKQRLDIYSNAIKQRGFQQLAKEYDTTVSKGCNKLGFSPGMTVIDQDEFKFTLANGLFQGKMRHQGAIVESALAIESEYAAQPEIYFVGQIQQGRIELKPVQLDLNSAQLDCVVTLTVK